MSIYQFLIAVRSEGAQLTSADGETTRYTLHIKLYYQHCQQSTLYFPVI